jgi:hypothetical protein
MDLEAETELKSIVDGLSPEGRASIASLREDWVTQLHFGLGVYIRIGSVRGDCGHCSVGRERKYPTGVSASI